MNEVDPITGLPLIDNGYEESAPKCSTPKYSTPRRAQSPLVRGSHLDKSRKRFPSTLPEDIEMQEPVKRGELYGCIPPSRKVIHHKEKMDNINNSIQNVIEGKEEHVTLDEIAKSDPINLEKTRFTMTAKKVKLMFMEDVIDRMEDDMWLHPKDYEERCERWNKAIDRSLKFLNKFINKQPRVDPNSSLCHYRLDRSIGESSYGTTNTCASVVQSSKRMKNKVTPKESRIGVSRKRLQKSKGSAADRVDVVGNLTLPAPKEKIPRKQQTEGDVNAIVSKAVKKPQFGRKKKEVSNVNDGDANTETKKPDFGRKRKNITNEDGECAEKEAKNLGRKKMTAVKADVPPHVEKEKVKRTTQRKKKGNEDKVDEDEPHAKKSRNEENEETGGNKEPNSLKKPAFGVKKGKGKSTSSKESATIETEKEDAVEIPSTKNATEKDNVEIDKNVKDKIDEYDDVEKDDTEISLSQQILSQKNTQPISSPYVPSRVDDEDMESDNEEWEPDERKETEVIPSSLSIDHSSSTQSNGLQPTSLSIPSNVSIDHSSTVINNGLLSSSHDPLLISSISSVASNCSESSQSIFESANTSFNSSNYQSADVSFSSQCDGSSSSLLTSSLLNLSSSMLTQPLNTSTQIPKSTEEPMTSTVESKSSQAEGADTSKKGRGESGGPRVRPTFGKKK